MQPVALALPSAHVFEGMRAALATGAVALGPPGLGHRPQRAVAGRGRLLFARQFRPARARGALLSIGE